MIINGISTKKYKDRDWDSYRNHTIGFVFQSYNLIPHQNILSNVELALTISGISKSERRKRAKEALEKVGLGDQLHKRPNQMSGGQMQRVAIARALVNDPDILLADEPTGALDSETSLQVMDLLNEVAKDRLVIMVTHNPELAEKYANRVVKLADGKITGDTNPFEIQETAKVKRFFYFLIRDHIYRNFRYECQSQTIDGYLYKNNKRYVPTVIGKIKYIFARSYIFRKVFVPVIDEVFREYYEDYMIESLKEMNKITEEKYNSKLTIVVWPDSYGEKFIRKLKEANLDLIFLSEEFNSEEKGYKIKNEGHPTAKANKEVAEILYNHIK